MKPQSDCSFAADRRGSQLASAASILNSQKLTKSLEFFLSRPFSLILYGRLSVDRMMVSAPTSIPALLCGC